MSISIEAITQANKAGDLTAHDAEQVKFMDEEYCIVVDNDDNVIGRETKKASTSSF